MIALPSAVCVCCYALEKIELLDCILSGYYERVLLANFWPAFEFPHSASLKSYVVFEGSSLRCTHLVVIVACWWGSPFLRARVARLHTLSFAP